MGEPYVRLGNPEGYVTFGLIWSLAHVIIRKEIVNKGTESLRMRVWLVSLIEKTRGGAFEGEIISFFSRSGNFL